MEGQEVSELSLRQQIANEVVRAIDLAMTGKWRKWEELPEEAQLYAEQYADLIIKAVADKIRTVPKLYINDPNYASGYKSAIDDMLRMLLAQAEGEGQEASGEDKKIEQGN